MAKSLWEQWVGFGRVALLLAAATMLLTDFRFERRTAELLNGIRHPPLVLPPEDSAEFLTQSNVPVPKSGEPGFDPVLDTLQKAENPFGRFWDYVWIGKDNHGYSRDQLMKARRWATLESRPHNDPWADEERAYYEAKYNVSAYPQKPICVVVPSYMNAQNERYAHNLRSIFQQQYANYRVVYIDDASADGTGAKVKAWAAQMGISKRKLEVIVNAERKLAMANIVKGVSWCKPHEIVIIVDGDDYLVGRQVFKLFNQIYSANDVWVAYTNYITSRGNHGLSRSYSDVAI